MKISNYNSQKIRVLNLFAILMVLYIHGDYIEATEFKYANVLQGLLGFSGLSLLANPLFFCISGFLFLTECKA